MANYFLTKVSVERPTEDGLMKKFKDTYLVKAESMGEVERIVIRETGGDVLSVRDYKISEYVLDDCNEGSIYFKARVMLSYLDADTGKIKRSAVNLLSRNLNVNYVAQTFQDALDRGQSDYEILSIAKTPIKDIFGRED